MEVLLEGHALSYAVAMVAIARRSLVPALPIVLTAAFVAGCASHSTRPPADRSASRHAAESMIVAHGNSSLAQGVRRALTERGWHLIDYSADMTHAHVDYAAMARRAKYRLTLVDTPIARCRNGEQSYLYRITIIRNRDGDVPLAIAGANCLTPILGQFSNDLDQKQLARVPGQATRGTATQ